MFKANKKDKRKETPTQLFSCECYEIFKNAYFEDYIQTAISRVTQIGRFSLRFLTRKISKIRKILNLKLPDWLLWKIYQEHLVMRT